MNALLPLTDHEAHEFELEFAKAADELETLADINRRMAAKYEQRIADRKRTELRTIADLESLMQSERERHAEEMKSAQLRHELEMQALRDRIAEVRTTTKTSLEADRKMLEASKVALAALVSA